MFDIECKRSQALMSIFEKFAKLKNSILPIEMSFDSNSYSLSYTDQTSLPIRQESYATLTAHSVTRDMFSMPTTSTDT